MTSDAVAAVEKVCSTVVVVVVVVVWQLAVGSQPFVSQQLAASSQHPAPSIPLASSNPPSAGRQHVWFIVGCRLLDVCCWPVV